MLGKLGATAFLWMALVSATPAPPEPVPIDKIARANPLTTNLTSTGGAARTTPAIWCNGDLAADCHYLGVADATKRGEIHTYLLSAIS